MGLQEFLNAIDKRSVVSVFVDGACSGNPGPGGWGVVAKQGQFRFEINDGERYTTNNRMELLGAINAILSLETCEVLSITTDSQYVKNGIESWLPKWKSSNWQTTSKTPVKNQDLWQTLDTISRNKKISWHWVRGHSGVVENERADTLARQAIMKMMITPGDTPPQKHSASLF
ncbi:MAG: ribonuclease HI [Holosporales bacterium]|nr:ribonuclease HI [Holosporales bacterium]